MTDLDVSTVQRLLEAPVYLSAEHALQTALPSIAVTIVAVTGVYLAAFPMAKKLVAKGNDVTQQRRRLAYQITNCVTNLALGCLGLYFQYLVLPHNNDDNNDTIPPQDKIQGHVEDRLYLLGSIQIGFQIWSIVMGILFVRESKEMLVHHCAVILASSKSVFLTNGFRYYAPMALGMTELSSVPLAIMNSFKNNAQWRMAHPQLYLASRLVFSLAFLTIRIGMFVPQHLEYLQYALAVTYWAEEGVAYKLYMSISWLGAVFLLFLQLYWGWLIVNGLSKFALDRFQIKGKILDHSRATATKKTN
ncbi:TLC domain [Seminavis robusta]|uniref:TLC domain n=1 Tax=Seminavis robusta TaxID=568900 RepID=A0A9N8D5X8_9STRA|nr:TLC domain [Seminavis robusta]|eukprot:Sro13_g009710.1 TLC domain (304) ;mRNA; r:12492-13403